MVARLLLIAGGLAGAWLAAHAARAQPKTHPKRKRRVIRRPATQEALQGQSNNIAAVPAQPASQLPSAAPAPALGDGAGHALLLLQALLSLAAVLWGDRLRPDGYTSQEWQQLVATVAVGASALTLAAHALLTLGRRGSPEEIAPSAVVAPMPAHLPAVLAPVQPAVSLQDLSGTWIKERDASDSMEPACDAMRLNGIVRTAIRLIKGLELRLDGGQFRMSVLSGILWFKISEDYPLDGAPARHRRRDLRRGGHTGRVERCPLSGDLLLRLEWGEPLGGTGLDRFSLAEPDVLHVLTELVVGGQAVRYRQVYCRR